MKQNGHEGHLQTFQKRMSSILKIALLGLAVIVAQTSFSQGYNIVINPSVTNVAPGATFNVTVRLESVSGSVTGAEAHVDFDNTKLQVTAIAPSAGNLLPNAIGSPDNTLESIATINADGHFHYGSFNLTTQTATFDYLDVTFQVLGGAPAGPTSLTFTTVAPHETFPSFAGNSVLNNLVNGTVNISASCTPPTATLAATPTCDAQDFALVLDAATGTAPFDLVVNGVTYNDVAIGGQIAAVSVPNESIFATATPTNTNLNDGDAIEFGTQFYPTVNGFVKGVRFYSGTTISGTYSGRLYAAGNSSALASVDFGTVTPGWNEILFPQAIPVTANTLYIVSTYSSDGNYSATDEYFLNGYSETSTNGYLVAPASNLGDTLNGLFFFGGTGGLPTSSFVGSCYFADVVFSPSEFSYELTSVTGDDGCNATGSLQTLNVTSVDCSTLPVSLLGLSASADGSNRIILKWATSSEQNNKGFEILRSLDGRSNWQSIGFVNGAGDSYTRKDYSYADNNLIARRYYYQLKQIDFDGRYKYTAVVSANLGGKEGFALEQNFPNPFKSQETTIRFTLPRRTQVQLIVYDMNGRVVKTLVNGTRDAGTHAIPFQDNALPTGIYFYKLSADGYSDVKKMTVR